MLVYAIIAAKSTSIRPDLSYEDWAAGNDAWKTKCSDCVGNRIMWINLLCQPTHAGVRSFSWSKDPWCEFVWPLRKVPVVFFCVCVCFFGGMVKGDTDMVCLGFPFPDVKPATGKNIGAGTGHWKLKIWSTALLEVEKMVKNWQGAGWKTCYFQSNKVWHSKWGSYHLEFLDIGMSQTEFYSRISHRMFGCSYFRSVRKVHQFWMLMVSHGIQGAGFFLVAYWYPLPSFPWSIKWNLGFLKTKTCHKTSWPGVRTEIIIRPQQTQGSSRGGFMSHITPKRDSRPYRLVDWRVWEPTVGAHGYSTEDCVGNHEPRSFLSGYRFFFVSSNENSKLNISGF